MEHILPFLAVFVSLLRPGWLLKRHGHAVTAPDVPPQGNAGGEVLEWDTSTPGSATCTSSLSISAHLKKGSSDNKPLAGAPLTQA